MLAQLILAALPAPWNSLAIGGLFVAVFVGLPILTGCTIHKTLSEGEEDGPWSGH